MNFSPLTWQEFFDRKIHVEIEGGDKFNVYMKGTSGPLFYLLHGGGYTGLSWACFSEQLSTSIECQILAPDLREHGESHAADEENQDMSAERLVKDICAIYSQLYANLAKHPPMILVGHSMGGALAIRIAHAKMLPNIVVVSAIDVVEGSAMASLSVMQQFLRNRPQTFSNVERGIEWCVRNHVTSNLRAARISMPSRLCAFEDKNGQEMFRWRTNLVRTEPYWKGWFQGLSKMFLECKDPAKVLILANVDRLDKELLTGQMRGQFQLEVLHKVGHAVHEDSPEMVAKIFIQLVNRYKVIFSKC